MSIVKKKGGRGVLYLTHESDHLFMRRENTIC